MNTIRARDLVLLAVALIAYATLSACGGSGDNATATTTTQGTTSGSTVTSAAATGTSGNRNTDVVKSGFSEVVASSFNSYGCGVIIHNLNQAEGADQVNWNATLYDAAGANVGGTYGYMQAMLPDETRAVDSCGGQTSPTTATIARIKVTTSVCDACWHAIAKQAHATATVANLDIAHSKATGTAHNPFSVALQNVYIVLVDYNAAGEIVGTNGAHLDSLAANSDTPWESQAYVDSRSNAVLDHVDAFVEPASLRLTDIQ